jgi:peptide methionine sulfoxide reductase MsrA
LIADLQSRGYEVKTELVEAGEFWQAEARHQKYCDSRGMSPKDHYTKRF